MRSGVPQQPGAGRAVRARAATTSSGHAGRVLRRRRLRLPARVRRDAVCARSAAGHPRHRPRRRPRPRDQPHGDLQLGRPVPPRGRLHLSLVAGCRWRKRAPTSASTVRTCSPLLQTEDGQRSGRACSDARGVLFFVSNLTDQHLLVRIPHVGAGVTDLNEVAGESRRQLRLLAPPTAPHDGSAGRRDHRYCEGASYARMATTLELPRAGGMGRRSCCSELVGRSRVTAQDGGPAARRAGRESRPTERPPGRPASRLRRLSPIGSPIRGCTPLRSCAILPGLRSRLPYFPGDVLARLFLQERPHAGDQGTGERAASRESARVRAWRYRPHQRAGDRGRATSACSSTRAWSSGATTRGCEPPSPFAAYHARHRGGAHLPAAFAPHREDRGAPTRQGAPREAVLPPRSRRSVPPASKRIVPAPVRREGRRGGGRTAQDERRLRPPAWAEELRHSTNP